MSLQAFFLILKESFNPEYITENIPGSIYVAYSVNKGEELSLKAEFLLNKNNTFSIKNLIFKDEKSFPTNSLMEVSIF